MSRAQFRPVCNLAIHMPGGCGKSWLSEILYCTCTTCVCIVLQMAGILKQLYTVALYVMTVLCILYLSLPPSSLPPSLYSSEVTDSSSEGSVEDDAMRPPPQPKQKALQTRRSMLDHLDDSTKNTPTTGTEPGGQAPSAKRVKKEEEVGPFFWLIFTPLGGIY